jgi:hypothetical protein
LLWCRLEDQEARVNPAHVALAELERLGLVDLLVTQNVDVLHELYVADIYRMGRGSSIHPGSHSSAYRTCL